MGMKKSEPQTINEAAVRKIVAEATRDLRRRVKALEDELRITEEDETIREWDTWRDAY